jgi:zeaxanthin glucosyltransferase
MNYWDYDLAHRDIMGLEEVYSSNMKHIGLICPAETGHLNTMLPLGQELQRRGYRVTYFGIQDAKPKLSASGLEFCALGEAEFPMGSTANLFEQLGAMQGLSAVLFTLRWLRHTAATVLAEAPAMMQSTQVDALIVDQITPEGGTIAEYLKIPFITLCSALPFNQEASIPPVFTNWRYQSTLWAKLRNSLTYQLTNPFAQSMRTLRSRYRKQWGLPPETVTNSSWAILSQQPAEFEFPRQQLPANFYFTGPFHTSRKPVEFPWERLTGQPLIYASMGTLQNRLTTVFKAIATACVGLEAQLIISLGGTTPSAELLNLPGNPIVVPYAPQLDLLQKAALTITHAGMNTALESLTYGVPMVAIPVTNDQPGIAARIAWSGVGESVPLRQLTPAKLQQVVKKVFTEDSYRRNALRLKEAIQTAGGVCIAADIIEKVIHAHS